MLAPVVTHQELNAPASAGAFPFRHPDGCLQLAGVTTQRSSRAQTATINRDCPLSISPDGAARMFAWTKANLGFPPSRSRPSAIRQRPGRRTCGGRRHHPAGARRRTASRGASSSTSDGPGEPEPGEPADHDLDGPRDRRPKRPALAPGDRLGWIGLEPRPGARVARRRVATGDAGATAAALVPLGGAR